MKKIIYLLSLIVLVAAQQQCKTQDLAYDCFSSSISAGYVFKTGDSLFKEIYGHGMANVITGDVCYNVLESWGIGAKISYWRANGHTTFLQYHTLLQEVPITAYIRGTAQLTCNGQLYASLGGGAAWIKEKSYLGDVHTWKGIGEAEIGINYPLWRCINFTSAIRYLFPRQSEDCHTITVGGFDLRAGFGFSF